MRLSSAFSVRRGGGVDAQEGARTGALLAHQPVERAGVHVGVQAEQLVDDADDATSRTGRWPSSTSTWSASPGATPRISASFAVSTTPSRGGATTDRSAPRMRRSSPSGSSPKSATRRSRVLVAEARRDHPEGLGAEHARQRGPPRAAPARGAARGTPPSRPRAAPRGTGRRRGTRSRRRRSARRSGSRRRAAMPSTERAARAGRRARLRQIIRSGRRQPARERRGARAGPRGSAPAARAASPRRAASASTRRTAASAPTPRRQRAHDATADRRSRSTPGAKRSTGKW